jgi:DNA-binding transcriptional regulator WhiA
VRIANILCRNDEPINDVIIREILLKLDEPDIPLSELMELLNKHDQNEGVKEALRRLELFI